MRFMTAGQEESLHLQAEHLSKPENQTTAGFSLTQLLMLRPRRQMLTVTCKTGIMSEERESRVCSFTAPPLIATATIAFKALLHILLSVLLLLHHLSATNIQINHILTPFFILPFLVN